ncbi:hypothetical protein H2203_004260 [Taxawa tesnikishii (nom. ined.)]|nr:hypothetical protein H2203_004260 [Dothideales sp. JES 119]
MGLLKGQSMAIGGVPDITITAVFAELAGVLRDGNVWIKISVSYRCSYVDLEYNDLEHLYRVGKDPSDKEPFVEIDDAAWICSLSI